MHLEGSLLVWVSICERPSGPAQERHFKNLTTQVSPSIGGAVRTSGSENSSATDPPVPRPETFS